jgi:hypothetical protein
MTTSTQEDGSYITNFGLFPGDYFVQAGGSQGYIVEVYDGFLCPLGRCDLTAGTPVTVTGTSMTSGINFALELGGSISGSVVDSVTMERVSSSVYIYDDLGDLLVAAFVNSNGQYSLTGLPGGTYFARTVNYEGYLDQLFDSITCSGCDPIDGTSIFVDKGYETSDVDFRLESGGGYITGTITDGITGQPLSGTAIWIYDQDGRWVTYGLSGADGGYIHYGGLTTGLYQAVAIYDWRGYLNEVYDDIVCLGVSCASPNGTSILVDFGLETSGVDFALKLRLIFADGFEGGGTSQWSATE